MNYWDKTKHEKFPEIKDFSNPQNKKRDAPGYKLSTADWFWFNPFAYRYIMIALPFCFLIGSLILVFICAFYDWKFFGVISLIIIGISGFKLVQALRKRRVWKEARINFYDQFLREYPEGRGVPKK